MMTSDAPGSSVQEELIGGVAALAGLDLPQDRIAALALAAAPVHGLLDLLHRDDLGEVPPATAFNASWK